MPSDGTLGLAMFLGLGKEKPVGKPKRNRKAIKKKRKQKR